MDKSSINTIFNSLFSWVEGRGCGYDWKKHRNMCFFAFVENKSAKNVVYLE
jgi:hypothetical protein